MKKLLPNAGVAVIITAIIGTIAAYRRKSDSRFASYASTKVGFEEVME